MSRQILQIDSETGEQLDGGMLIYIPKRPKLKERWLMTFQDGLDALAANPDLTGRDWRVLAKLMSKLDFENYIHITQTAIAKELKLDQANVQRSFAKLIKAGIILVGPKVGRSHTYRLSPELGWKGTVTNLKEERIKHLRLAINNLREKPAEPENEPPSAA